MPRGRGQGSVFVHYLITEEKLRIILTTPYMPPLVRDTPISTKELNHKIDDFRQTLQNPLKDPFQEAKALYKLVLEPIAEDLKQAEAKTLMLSLDGTLRYLPFPALHDGTGYMAEKYRMVVFTEAAKTRIEAKPTANWRLAGFGLSRKIGDFDLLEGVKAELTGIAQILPGNIYLDGDFNSPNIQMVLGESYAVLHIASHFVFQPGKEIDSFLLLGDGKRLTLDQIKDGAYDFNGVELMTLSACNTGVGGNGREIEGFGAMVQINGAKAVLATLWPVADQSTSIFMQNMYRIHEKEKLSKAEALQKAQIMFIKDEDLGGGDGDGGAKGRGRVLGLSTKDEKPAQTGAYTPDPKAPYAHPYYWAPFILMGNWR